MESTQINQVVDEKGPAPGKPVSYARICLKVQFLLIKSMLKGKGASVIRLSNGSVYLMPQYEGPKLMPIHNWPFLIHPL